MCTILDEPTAGLHPRDTARLIATPAPACCDKGTASLVVEHDLAMIQAADWVLDLGPGAGPDGGPVVAAGPPDQLAASSSSVTGRYLGRGRGSPPLRASGSRAVPGWIEIQRRSAS